MSERGREKKRARVSVCVCGVNVVCGVRVVCGVICVCERECVKECVYQVQECVCQV